MAISSLGCMSESTTGFLGSAIVLDVSPMDLSNADHAESYAEMIGVLQLATGGAFNNRSKVIDQIVVPYILIK